jgi:hypothetical protein
MTERQWLKGPELSEVWLYLCGRASERKLRLLAIYEERAFDRLPILGDALEEAGCDNPAILSHCRDGGDNVRGCWVLDLLLGQT